MPTYEYECSHCGNKFEKFQSITAAPLKKCPACGKKVQRLIGTGAGLIFKGSGFYITDYRSDSYKEKAKADTAGSSSDAKPADTRAASNGSATESKPAAKTEPPAPKAEAKPAPRSDSKDRPRKR